MVPVAFDSVLTKTINPNNSPPLSTSFFTAHLTKMLSTLLLPVWSNALLRNARTRATASGYIVLESIKARHCQQHWSFLEVQRATPRRCYQSFRERNNQQKHKSQQRHMHSNTAGGWIVGFFAVTCGVGSAIVMARMESAEEEQLLQISNNG
jgi:hypothetical protein